MKKLLYILMAIVLVLLAVFVALGLYIPDEQEFTQVTEIDASAESVWRVLEEREKFPEWQDQVESIEVRNDKEWTEVTPGGPIDFRIVSEEEPRSMNIRYSMGDSFEGSWQGDLSPRGENKTLLRTRDAVKVNGWPTKIMMWFFFDLEEFAKDWNGKLKKRAETVNDER